jgi:hypothetical protein
MAIIDAVELQTIVLDIVFAQKNVRGLWIQGEAEPREVNGIGFRVRELMRMVRAST